MEIPSHEYIALYGSHSGDWREGLKKVTRAAGLDFYDPTDPGWAGIHEGNGDERQGEIDGLVAKQHEGLHGAACVIFHLARRVTVNGLETGETTTALASRCEFGFLTGRGISTFVHIEPDVEGRNYLWAQIAPYPHMRRCDDLLMATRLAIDFVKSRSRP